VRVLTTMGAGRGHGTPIGGAFDREYTPRARILGAVRVVKRVNGRNMTERGAGARDGRVGMPARVLQM